MKLYHGSKYVIPVPIHKGSKADNDYGPAFYLTRDLESAHEWACRNNDIGYVNKYDLDINKLKVLDLTDKTKYSVLHWISILVHFRELNDNFVKSFKSRLDYLENNYFINPYDYDVVIGYRADDAYFRFPLDFIRGNITLEQLESSYQLGELGIQYALTSEKAINSLKYIDSSLSTRNYIDKYFKRVQNATELYDSLSKDEEGTRIYDIMRNDKK